MDLSGKRALSSQLENSAPESEAAHRPAKAAKRGEAEKASARHIKTEQARRDKISAGFAKLSQLLPGREKVEKALLLSQAADYIIQLQGVLKLVMSSGAIGKLPDELQFQIRTLLPRKDHCLAAPAPDAAPAAAPAPPAALPQLPGMQLPFLPLQPQAPEPGKDLPADEPSLVSQLQAMLQQQQQAQQMQSLLQALQLQQALAQQQQQQSSGALSVPDLMASVAGASHPMAALQLPGASGCFQLPGAGSLPLASQAPPPAQLQEPLPAPVPRRPAGCFASDLPKCGLQQLVDAAACEPSSGTLRPARKGAKVRRHTTAARIPKPEQEPQAPARAAGRPGPV